MLKKNLKAYTLLELLIVISLTALIAALLFPISLKQIGENKLKNSTRNLTSLIFNSQQNAYARREQEAYGVVFQSGGMTLYSGDNYATATSQEYIDLENGITITQINLNAGGSEVNFPAGEFKPSTAGTIVLSEENNTYKIILNEEGYIYYQKI